MSRPLNRLLLAGTSALGITALALGLTAPAVAAPTTSQNDPESVTAAIDEWKNTPFFGMLPGAAADQLTRTPASQARGARTATPTTSSIPVVGEVERTANSATFRFTLPAGEVTRDGAVLQAYWTDSTRRYSELSYLTNPVGYEGADNFWGYDEQVVGTQVANLLRENFSITGATAVTGGLNDYLVIPAGLETFDITVSSARTPAELGEAIEQLTGTLGWAEYDASWIHQSRLALPEPEMWTYGDRVDVISAPATAAQVPDGADELNALISNNLGNAELRVTRQDEDPFSGDRVLRISDSTTFWGGITGIGDDTLFDLIVEWTPPPLRPINLNTVVTGATPVGNDFYKPTAGVREVLVTTTHEGPQSLEEAQSSFTTWVTETCGAEMTDAIPGTSADDAEGPMTWQDYFEIITYTEEESYTVAPPLYTGPEFIGAALEAIADQSAVFRHVLTTSAGNQDSMVANVLDWDAACGATEGPGDNEGPGDGDDEPGDTNEPATVSLSVPDAAEAGTPITLSATVLDDNSDPVAGQPVTFTIEEEEDPAAGTLRAAALTLDRAGDGPTILTGTTDANGVATVTYTPTASGTLRVTASTGGDNPVSTGPAATIPVTTAPGDGGGNDNDDDDNTDGGGNQSGSGALGSLFGSLGSSGS